MWLVLFELEGVQDRRCLPIVEQGALVDADLDTLATALYVRVDDLLKATPNVGRGGRGLGSRRRSATPSW